MGNNKEDSSFLQKLNSFTEIIVAKNDFLAKQKETQRTANWQSSINNKIIHEQEIEKLKNEFIEMGVIDAFTQIIDNRILSSLWDKPEEATYGLWGRKKIIKPAFYGEKESIIYGTNLISLDLHGSTFEGEEVPTNSNWTDSDGPPNYRCSRLNVRKQTDGKFKVGFNQNYHGRDNFICNRLENKIVENVEKDEVTNTIVKLIANYIAIFQQENKFHYR